MKHSKQSIYKKTHRFLHFCFGSLVFAELSQSKCRSSPSRCCFTLWLRRSESPAVRCEFVSDSRAVSCRVVLCCVVLSLTARVVDLMPARPAVSCMLQGTCLPGNSRAARGLQVKTDTLFHFLSFLSLSFSSFSARKLHTYFLISSSLLCEIPTILR